MTSPEPPKEELRRMSFGDHLDELRRRLVRSLIAVLVCVFGLFPFKREVTNFYLEPYREMWDLAYGNYVERLESKVRDAGGLERLHATERETVEFNRRYAEEIRTGRFPMGEAWRIEVQSGFRLPWSLKSLSAMEDLWTFMAATLIFGLLLAGPYVLWQAWAFVAAGLYSQEKKVARGYFPVSLGLLALGAAFGYFVAVPACIYFLVQMMDFNQVEPLISVGQYFHFLFTLTAALGLMFQLPLAMMALVKLGLIEHRTLVVHWRYVLLAIFVIAAVASPTVDPFSQLLMATPMVLLYGLGLVFTGRVARQRAAAMPTMAAGT